MSLGVEVDIDLAIETCELITGVTVLPLEVFVGGEIALSATVVADGPTLLWRATAGSFEDPTAANTLYFCDVGGEHVLTFATIDVRGCTDAVEVPVVCGYSPRCGDGRLDPGEQCDDGNSLPADGCSAHCLNSIGGVD